MSPKLIEIHEVSKSFGPILANNKVTFAVEQNTIHGIVGENGAGKSTIMKILYGMIQPDCGDIYLKGNPVRIASPQHAIRLGIGMVHQHFMLVPTLTVLENIILGSEPHRLLHLNRNLIAKNLESLQQSFGFSLDLHSRISDLDVGHKQQVEILKLLYRNAEILILDEPTAVLTLQEVDVLFTQLNGLLKLGKTIVLITHKLREILRFTIAVTVMRQGRVVDTVQSSSLDEEGLAQKMIGRKLRHFSKREKPLQKKCLLSVKNLTLRTEAKPKLSGVSFKLCAGEILGIAGVEGNGQHELSEILSGVEHDYDGTVTLHDCNLSGEKPYEIRQRGLAVIPPDRHLEGLILNFSVMENFLLGHHRERPFSTHGWMQKKRSLPHIREVLHRFDVRPLIPLAPMNALSGGNQQKVVVARELSRTPEVIIASHPTRGVDIGAIEFIHSQLLKLREEGAAILLISSELDEILALSDRIIVLYEGSITGETSRNEAEETNLGLWMTGGQSR